MSFLYYYYGQQCGWRSGNFAGIIDNSKNYEICNPDADEPDEPESITVEWDDLDDYSDKGELQSMFAGFPINDCSYEVFDSHKEAVEKITKELNKTWFSERTAYRIKCLQSMLEAAKLES